MYMKNLYKLCDNHKYYVKMMEIDISKMYNHTFHALCVKIKYDHK